MTKLPDALLLRDAWLGSAPRKRQYDRHLYLAVSVWADEEGAKEAVSAIRATGRLARLTKEVRPRRARPPEPRYGARTPKPWGVAPPDCRYMWVVWEEGAP